MEQASLEAMRPGDAIVRMLAIFDEQKWDRLDEVCTPDITVEFGGAEYVGFEQVAAFQSQIYKALPDLVHHVENVVNDIEQSRAAVEFLVTATHVGDFPSPIGPLPGTGKPASWYAAGFARIRDGKVAQWKGYVDLLTVIRELGGEVSTQA